MSYQIKRPSKKENINQTKNIHNNTYFFITFAYIMIIAIIFGSAYLIYINNEQIIQIIQKYTNLKLNQIKKNITFKTKLYNTITFINQSKSTI